MMWRLNKLEHKLRNNLLNGIKLNLDYNGRLTIFNNVLGGLILWLDGS